MKVSQHLRALGKLSATEQREVEWLDNEKIELVPCLQGDTRYPMKVIMNIGGKFVVGSEHHLPFLHRGKAKDMFIIEKKLENVLKYVDKGWTMVFDTQWVSLPWNKLQSVALGVFRDSKKMMAAIAQKVEQPTPTLKTLVLPVVKKILFRFKLRFKQRLSSMGESPGSRIIKKLAKAIVDGSDTLPCPKNDATFLLALVHFCEDNLIMSKEEISKNI